MSEQPRPGQATFAACVIIGGSLLAIVTAWERIAGLHTVEGQEAIARAVEGDPFGVGMSVDTLSTVVRVLCLIGGGASAAAAILGLHVLKRSPSARIALTALTPLIFVGWLGAGNMGLFEPMVLAAIAVLWIPPTRDWYAGRDWMPRASENAPGPRNGRADPFAPPARPHENVPEQGLGHLPPPSPAQAPAPAYRSVPVPPGGWPPPTVRRPRPLALIWACVITWISTAVVGGSLAITSLAFLAGGRDFVDDVGRQEPQLSAGDLVDLRNAIYVLTAVALPWCLVAAGLAVLAIVGRWRPARLALAACSGGTGAVCVVLAVTLTPVAALPAAAAIVTAALLARPEVAAWRP